MTPSLLSRPLASGRFRATRLTAALALAAMLAACVASDSTNGLSDKNAPTVSLSAGSVSDSQLTFNVSATDNLGLLHVNAVAGAPGISLVCDTTFNTAVTTFTRMCTIGVPSSVPIGTTVTVLAQSVDGNHNISPVDTLLMVTGGGSPSVVVLTSPRNSPRDTIPVGFTTAVSVSGKAKSKVFVLGWEVAGVFAPPRRDSTRYPSPMLDSTALNRQADFTGATPGTGTITPFMYDSLGRLYVGAPVTIEVVATAGTNTIPVVDFGITKRIEVTDTIHVTATDRAGVHVIGYVIRDMAQPPNDTIIARDSVIVAANVSTAIHTFKMALPIATFPKGVTAQAFATNNTGRQDSARIPVGSTGVVRRDTVTVVAGLTRPLPSGGRVADGIYHTPSNRLYLSNIEKNQLEVFSLADSSFHAPIAVGSRPWGIAARPLNRAGAMTDTLIVANSGGTLLSFVDVNAVTPHEVYRYALPNILFFTVTSVTGPGGSIVEHRKQHDFSDRPQYVAATCTGAGVCGDLVVAYSTTPTAGQTLPFTNQGTIRYENITQRTSHFFFEQAVGQSDAANIDTIEVDRFAAGGYGIDATLVPFLQGPFITGPDTSFFSVTTNTPLIGFRDTTFTRNSGNFQRAVFGEGGRVGSTSGLPNARAMTFDVTVGMVTTFVGKGHLYVLPVPVFDGGISRPGAVSDFIANTSTSVSGVAINFDGGASAVRADSTALFDLGLRLQGLLQTSAGNAGVDFHPLNTGVPRPGATGGTQLMFTASAQAEIQVWNTNTYQLCLSVPTRDPVIGPIKSAALAGGATMIVGATTYGVVVVTIPQAQMSAACP